MNPLSVSPPAGPGPGKGLFLAFEGIDGAGKTTQAARLAARLRSLNLEVVTVKEPTDGVWGKKIRTIALKGRQHVPPARELEYFLKDRAEDVALHIAPALAADRIVIADRYFYSTIAYQSALGLSEWEIRQKNECFPVPDAVFLLEVSTSLSQTRITRSRGDTANLGYEQEGFLQKVKAAFDRMDDPNIVRLDGAKAEDEVAQAIWDHVTRLPSFPGLLHRV